MRGGEVIEKVGSLGKDAFLHSKTSKIIEIEGDILSLTLPIICRFCGAAQKILIYLLPCQSFQP